MKKSLVDLLIERKKEEKKYFQDPIAWAKKIKKEVKNLLGETQVFIFGSVARKKTGPRSDIDVLVVSPQLKTTAIKSQVRAKIWKKLGFLSPFEIHLVTPSEFSWYQRFIDKKITI